MAPGSILCGALIVPTQCVNRLYNWADFRFGGHISSLVSIVLCLPTQGAYVNPTPTEGIWTFDS